MVDSAPLNGVENVHFVLIAEGSREPLERLDEIPIYEDPNEPAYRPGFIANAITQSREFSFQLIEHISDRGRAEGDCSPGDEVAKHWVEVDRRHRRPGGRAFINIRMMARRRALNERVP
jgi:hypothetical protein